jgi:hypothetical protein
MTDTPHYDSYAIAWDEWEASGKDAVWAVTAGDGLDSVASYSSMMSSAGSALTILTVFSVLPAMERSTRDYCSSDHERVSCWTTPFGLILA